MNRGTQFEQRAVEGSGRPATLSVGGRFAFGRPLPWAALLFAVSLGIFSSIAGCQRAGEGAGAHTSARASTTATRVINDAEGHPVAVGDLSRIVVAGGAVTEVVFALGMGANVVGADSSSTFPPEASQRPQVGYVRALGAEGLVALRPTLVLTTMEAGPPAVLQQLAAAQVPVMRVPATPGLDGARARIRLIAEALHRAAQGDAMVATLDREAAAIPTAPAQKQRVVFVMARGSGAPNVAGRATAADAMIALAGGENAVTGYEGYRPLTPESLVQAAPTVLLFTTRGLASLGGEAGALALPGVALTPAGRDRRIVAMDDLELLGFGPRCARAAATLSQRINAAPAPPSASADPSAAPSATATP